MGGAVTRLSDEEIRALRAKLEEHAAVSSDPSVPVMLSLLAEAQASRERWQPMETAPKDGTPILVVVRDPRGYTVARWTFDPCPHGQEYPDGFADDVGFPECIVWMPLPAPPSEDRP